MLLCCNMSNTSLATVITIQRVRVCRALADVWRAFYFDCDVLMGAWPSLRSQFVYSFSKRLEWRASIRVSVCSCILSDPALAFLVALRTSNLDLDLLAAAQGCFAQLCLTCGRFLRLSLNAFEQGHVLFHLIRTAREHHRLVLLWPFVRQEDALRASLYRQATEEWIWLAIRLDDFMICHSEIIMASLALRRMVNDRAFFFLLTSWMILLGVKASNLVRILSLARGAWQLLEKVNFQLQLFARFYHLLFLQDQWLWRLALITLIFGLLGLRRVVSAGSLLLDLVDLHLLDDLRLRRIHLLVLVLFLLSRLCRVVRSQKIYLAGCNRAPTNRRGLYSTCTGCQ